MLYIYTSMIYDEDDKPKFERLYNTYRKTMFFKAREILKDDYLAEDAVHLAFINIINNLDKIDEKNCHKTKGFIVIVTENVAIDMYRKLKPGSDISFDEIDYVIRDISPSVEEIYEYENENLIIKAILSLPKNYSSIMMLKYSHGYVDNEIAETLDITESNVRQRLSRGRKKLEEVLKEWEVDYHG
ncbi:MAG: sigma-70 family RNA polymerase sigma factor [Tissierella sp.]|nr:sigma-70 family RNA polymerase sigma factor [Tissierella sp.]